MFATIVYIEDIIAEILYFAAAPISFIVMLVCIIRLIIAKKEKRKQMKKVKIAAVVFALIAVAMGSKIIYDYINRPPPPPPRPPGYGTVEKMPNITGLLYKECKENYSDKFELVVEEEQYSSEYPEGVIIEQNPMEDLEYLVGMTTVKCKISKGPRMVAVSNVIGLDFEDANNILGENDRFTVGFVSEYSDDVPKGTVIATDPPAGEKVAYGSAVKVTVSGGKEPDVTASTEWYEELY